MSRLVKKTRKEQRVQWTERKASFRDKGNVIRTASNSSKSLNEIKAELGLDVCLFLYFSSVTDVAHIHSNKTMLPLTPATSQRTGSRLKESKCSIGRLAARTSIRLRTCGKCSFLVFIKIDNNIQAFKTAVQREWDAMSVDEPKKLVATRPNRVDKLEILSGDRLVHCHILEWVLYIHYTI
uniref:Transposable element Tc3 transposase-like DNA-binding HTH domain-containing protein n=1 Tax=Caenorhabditis japonica TaxID=281687 RepID=A0A8R1IUU0_CAEJA